MDNLGLLLPAEPPEACRICSPEAVDGLIRIPNDENLPPSPAPGLDQPVLEWTDILEFIYQKVGEDFPSFLRTLKCPDQKIVEIHGI